MGVFHLQHVFVISHWFILYSLCMTYHLYRRLQMVCLCLPDHLGSSVCIQANMCCTCCNACLFCCSTVRSTSTRPKVWWRYCLISSRRRTRARTRLSCGTAAPRTSSLWSLWIKVSHPLTRRWGVILVFVTERYEWRAQRYNRTEQVSWHLTGSIYSSHRVYMLSSVMWRCFL